MIDDADRADQHIEEVIQDAIGRARRSPSLPYTGLCHWCGDITGGGRRFCDADCREDWDRRHGRHRRA